MVHKKDARHPDCNVIDADNLPTAGQTVKTNFRYIEILLGFILQTSYRSEAFKMFSGLSPTSFKVR